MFYLVARSPIQNFSIVSSRRISGSSDPSEFLGCFLAKSVIVNLCKRRGTRKKATRTPKAITYAVPHLRTAVSKINVGRGKRRKPRGGTRRQENRCNDEKRTGEGSVYLELTHTEHCQRSRARSRAWRGPKSGSLPFVES